MGDRNNIVDGGKNRGGQGRVKNFYDYDYDYDYKYDYD
jgi:hypothetical protein